MDKPAHYEILTEDDKIGYEALKEQFRTMFATAKRPAKLTDTFRTVVDELRNYITCGDRDAELRRSLVCGIMWIDDVLAINTRHLARIVGKCKSSINCGFQALGYTTIQDNATTAAALTRAYPFMKTDFHAIRQWTFRLSPPSQLFSTAKQFISLDDYLMPLSDMNYEIDSTFC